MNKAQPSLPQKHTTQWFTLIEMLVVIAIAMVLLTISLRMNRSRIDDMKSQSERYQRHDRHLHTNTMMSTNNYIDNERVQSIQWIYSGNKIDLAIQTGIDTTYTVVDSFVRKHHTQNTSLTIIKKPFELGCTIAQTTTNDNSSWSLLQLMAVWSEKSYCFTLDAWLCDFQTCQ